MADEVEFICEIVKVQTLVDHGIRLTLDLPETAVLQAAQLMEFKRLGVVGDVVYRPVDDDSEQRKYRKIHI